MDEATSLVVPMKVAISEKKQCSEVNLEGKKVGGNPIIDINEIFATSDSSGSFDGFETSQDSISETNTHAQSLSPVTMATQESHYKQIGEDKITLLLENIVSLINKNALDLAQTSKKMEMIEKNTKDIKSQFQNNMLNFENKISNFQETVENKFELGNKKLSTLQTSFDLNHEKINVFQRECEGKLSNIDTGFQVLDNKIDHQVAALGELGQQVEQINKESKDNIIEILDKMMEHDAISKQERALMKSDIAKNSQELNVLQSNIKLNEQKIDTMENTLSQITILQAGQISKIKNCVLQQVENNASENRVMLGKIIINLDENKRDFESFRVAIHTDRGQIKEKFVEIFKNFQDLKEVPIKLGDLEDKIQVFVDKQNALENLLSTPTDPQVSSNLDVYAPEFVQNDADTSNKEYVSDQYRYRSSSREDSDYRSESSRDSDSQPRSCSNSRLYRPKQEGYRPHRSVSVPKHRTRRSDIHHLLQKEKPVFDGNNKSAPEFLEEVEKYKKIADLTSKELIILFPTFLKGKVRDWWNMMSGHIRSWSQIKHKILDHYFNDYEVDKVRRQWSDLKFKKGDDIEKFALDGLKMRRLINPEETINKRCERIVMKLPGALRDYLFCNKSRSEEHLLCNIKEAMRLKGYEENLVSKGNEKTDQYPKKKFTKYYKPYDKKQDTNKPQGGTDNSKSGNTKYSKGQTNSNYNKGNSHNNSRTFTKQNQNDFQNKNQAKPNKKKVSQLIRYDNKFFKNINQLTKYQARKESQQDGSAQTTASHSDGDTTKQEN